MKKTMAAFTAGFIIATAFSVYAASVTATENTYKVTVNGNEANISGYNINGSTFFKLRDVSEAVGGFSVGFDNEVITITTNGAGVPGEPRDGNAPSVEEMKERLEQDVSDGKMTQEQADEMISQMESGNMQRMNPPQGTAPQN